LLAREAKLVKKIPVVMCIDVEPDERLIDPELQEPWAGFELAYDFFSQLRSRLEAATGKPVHFSWFLRMDPQIAHTYGAADWVARRYPSLIDKIRSAGDALGLHVHAWRWEEKVENWVVDLDQSWVDHCVRLSFESFRASLNQPCAYFRFGDLWTSNATLALVEELGGKIDLTPEPGQRGCRADEFFAGSFVDTSEIPRRPYHPSPSDFRKPDAQNERKLWIIPLTTGSTDWSPKSFGSSVNSVDLSKRRGGRLIAKLNSMRETREGHLERADDEVISGWVYDRSQPDVPLEVEIYADESLLTTAIAAIFRPDLLAKGKGNGKHCFNVGVPSCLKDRKLHSIRAKVKGSSYYLCNCPLELVCAREEPKHMTLNLSFDTWSVCRIIERTLRESNNPYLGLVVRSDVLGRPDQRSNLEQTFEYLLSHPSISEVAFKTPRDMIASWPDS
jgi:hypothetical protein